MPASIGVVVLNWNSGYRLRRCLQAINKQEVAFDEVIVVDNGSIDDSLDVAASELGNVTVVRLPENIGYGGGMNVGMSALTSDYVVPLNCDCVLSVGFAAAAKRILSEAPSDIGILGGIVYRVGSIDTLVPETLASLDSGRMRVALDMRVSFRGEGEDAPVTKVTGACPIISRAGVECLGEYGFSGFDADYFAYGEDIDLSLRLMRLGYRVAYSSTLTALHERSYGAQRGVRGRSGLLRRYHLLNRYRNALRHAPRPLLGVSVVVIAAEDCAFAGSRLVKGDYSAAKDLALVWRSVARERRDQRRKGQALPRALSWREAYDLIPRRAALRHFQSRSLEDLGWFGR